MATISLPHVGPAPWLVTIETPNTTMQVPARDQHDAISAAWFQATGHAGHDYQVTIRIQGPGQALPTLTIPAALITGWPDPEPAAWELEPEPVEYEEDEIAAAFCNVR